MDKEIKLILLVEDDITSALLLGHFIKNLNYELIHVFTAESAVYLCKLRSFNLILMNIGLPYHDGFWASKQIRQITLDIPIIGYTVSDINTNLLKKAALSGMQALCNYWLSQDKLAQAVNQVTTHDIC